MSQNISEDTFLGCLLNELAWLLFSRQHLNSYFGQSEAEFLSSKMQIKKLKLY